MGDSRYFTTEKKSHIFESSTNRGATFNSSSEKQPLHMTGFGGQFVKQAIMGSTLRSSKNQNWGQSTGAAPPILLTQHGGGSSLMEFNRN